MKILLFASLLYLNLIYSSLCYSSYRIDLSGDWEFQRSGVNNWFPETVPGVVHLDLLENKLIEDPYFGNKEQKLSWIENQNWNYRKAFNVSFPQLKNKHIELIFKWLCTYSTV